MNVRTMLGRMLAALIMATCLPAITHASLVGRTLSGAAVAANDGYAVFVYDTDLNITWLRNANVNGPQTWNQANAWATALTVGAISGWRLPSTLQPDASCSFSGPLEPTGTASHGNGCSGSEMGHLWYTELGNIAGVLWFTGPFMGLQTNYWSSTKYAHQTDFSWYFSANWGFQTIAPQGIYMGAMAVRDGDVLNDGGGNNVPEPSSLGLAMLGLLLVGRTLRHRALPTVAALANAFSTHLK